MKCWVLEKPLLLCAQTNSHLWFQSHGWNMIGFKPCFLLGGEGGGISFQKNRARLLKREWVWNWSPGKLAGLVWPTPSFCYNLSVTIPFYFSHHMCIGVPARLEAYPPFSVLIIHVCIHEGKSMNSPFLFYQQMCVFPKICWVLKHWFLCVCSLSSLLFVCSWMESKLGRTISLRSWSLICLGTCVQWSIMHVLVLLLWR